MFAYHGEPIVRARGKLQSLDPWRLSINVAANLEHDARCRTRNASRRLTASVESEFMLIYQLVRRQETPQADWKASVSISLRQMTVKLFSNGRYLSTFDSGSLVKLTLLILHVGALRCLLI